MSSAATLLLWEIVYMLSRRELWRMEQSLIPLQGGGCLLVLLCTAMSRLLMDIQRLCKGGVLVSGGG